MDILCYRRGRCTAGGVRQEMPEAPGYSAARHASVLEEKGHVRHEEEALR